MVTQSGDAVCHRHGPHHAEIPLRHHDSAASKLPTSDTWTDKVHIAPPEWKQQVVTAYRKFRLQAVPAPFVVVLCCFMFFFGRFAQQSSDLPVPQGPQVVVAKRALQSELENLSKQIAKPGLTIPEKPLVADHLEKYMLESSAFNLYRPPLQPAPSGDNFYHAIPFQVISWYPRILLFPSFLDQERCDKVIQIAEKQMFPSGLAYRPGEKIQEFQETRTSSGTFLSAAMDNSGTLDWIENRIAAATQLPVENGEAFNVLRYKDGQHYDSHYDTFDPKDFGAQPSQRIATFLLYLTDVEEGGETVFKREGIDNGEKVINDWKSCDEGLKVKPKMGDAVLFWSVTPDLQLDHRALHGACPVTKGTKWSMAKWIRDKPVRPSPKRKLALS